MEREAEQSHSKFEEVHFLLEEKTVNLKVSLNDKNFWELDNSREQEVSDIQTYWHRLLTYRHSILA